MRLALIEAEQAVIRNEVPIGAILVDGATSAVIAASGNRVEELDDPTAHAEILVIREACATICTPRLPGYDLYVTLEPCAMCAAAISFARIRRLYFGAYDAKAGAVEHGPRFFDLPSCHHAPEIYGGVAEAEAREVLQAFFRGKR